MFFSKWDFCSMADSVTVVAPDGCQDILIMEADSANPGIRLTDLDDTARPVQLFKGQKISGYRLQPGLILDSLAVNGLEPKCEELEEFINHEAVKNIECAALIEALSQSHASVPSVARQAGVSPRTLQRWFKHMRLPKPEFWRLLSRARKAAIAQSSRVSLVEIANDCGYSDQAHMSRDFLRWFGLTPAQLRQDSALLLDICQPGLGNWTMEHSSTR